MAMKKYESVAAYFEDLNLLQASRLQELRELIKEIAPEAEESISYGMPSYTYFGQLVFIGAFAKHFSFFPGKYMDTYLEELADYKLGKGTLQIRYDQAIPKDTIRKIILDKMKANELKKKSKGK